MNREGTVAFELKKGLRENHKVAAYSELYLSSIKNPKYFNPSNKSGSLIHSWKDGEFKICCPVAMLRQVTRVLNKRLTELFNPNTKMHIISSSAVHA